MAIDLVNQNNSGSFIPTTFILDVARLNEVDVNSDEFKELLVRLYQNLNRMALSLNVKESGYFALNEFVTGGQYYPDTAQSSLINQNYRPITRKVINFGVLPNTGTKSVAHNINVTANTTWVLIEGTATDPIGKTGIELSYASPTAANNIELYVDATNVNVITGSNRSNYTICNIVLEFLTE